MTFSIRRLAEAGFDVAKVFLRLLRHSIYPERCVACGLTLFAKSSGCLCLECAYGMPLLPEKSCPRCAAPPMINSEAPCPDCNGVGFSFASAAAPFLYAKAAKALVKDLKYNHNKQLAAPMAESMLPLALQLAEKHKLNRLIPAPIHRKRLQQRGYNQAELLARELSVAMKLPLLSKVLTRLTYVKAQVKLNREERKINLANAFGIDKKQALPPASRILFIDDIITTCATADYASRALLNAGAEIVVVLAFARTRYN